MYMRDSVYTAQKPASPSFAIINIKNLRLRTLIGFNPEEKVKKQDVVLNIEIKHAVGDAVLEDHIEDALNYKVITKNVIQHVEQGQFLLLEKLVSDVLGICSDHPSIHYSRVTIDKPHALRFADSVSLTLEHQNTTASIHNYLEKAS
jgi:D-erythro-7,8-dihydroneopterin triphosphate epimerase